jgi:hypothetical protein
VLILGKYAFLALEQVGDKIWHEAVQLVEMGSLQRFVDDFRRIGNHHGAAERGRR